MTTCCSAAGFYLLLLPAACSQGDAMHPAGSIAQRRKTPRGLIPVGSCGACSIDLLLVPAWLRAGLGGCVGENKLQLPKDKPKFTLFLKDSASLEQIHEDTGGEQLALHRAREMPGWEAWQVTAPEFSSAEWPMWLESLWFCSSFQKNRQKRRYFPRNIPISSPSA